MGFKPAKYLLLSFLFLNNNAFAADLGGDPGSSSSAIALISVTIPHKLGLEISQSSEATGKLAIVSNYSGPFQIEHRSLERPFQIQSITLAENRLESRDLPSDGIVIVRPE